MPGMGDERFEHSVVYLCAHSEDGAMGLIVNKPSEKLKMSDVLEQLEIDRGNAEDIFVHFGGPVEHGRGFVLHSMDYASTEDTTLNVDGRFGLTATTNILKDMTNGCGPAQSILAMGYAGWGPGQLEQEITDNGWLTSDTDQELIFETQSDAQWTNALLGLGVDPRLLSGTAGHA